MLRKELEINIGPDGEVEIVTHGFKGPECLEAVRPFENAIGEVRHRELTSEYYERQTTEQTRRSRRR